MNESTSSTSRKIKNNIVYNTIKSVFTIIFPLITFPYVSRVLLTENLGKINFGLSIISYFSLLATLGINTYAVRECSKLKNDSKKLSETASNIFSINVYSTILSYLILLLILLFAHPLKHYRLLILIQSLSIIFTTVGADWINTVAEDFRYITFRTVGFNILSIILMFLFIHKPEDYIKYSIICVIASGGGNILNAFYRRRFCKIRFIVCPDYKYHIKPIIMLFTLQLVQIIYVNSDLTIIGLVRSDYEVGLYSASVRIYTLIQTLMNSIVFVVLPQLSLAFSKQDYKNINKLLRYSLNYIIGLGLPCLVGVNIVANDIIKILAGEAYLSCVPSLRILTIALFFSFLGGFLGNLIMIPSGKDKINLLSSILSAVANLILNLILIPKYGIEAAAFTTAFSMLIGFVFKYPFVDKEIDLKPLGKIFFGPCIGCILIVIAGYIVSFFELGFLVKFGITVVSCSVLYFICIVTLKNEFGLEIFRSIKNKTKRLFKK